MSYYILPKNNNRIIVNPMITQSSILLPYVSYSFLHYYLEIKKQIIEMFICDADLSNNTFEEAIRIINPYEFIFSKVPGSTFSVSKLKPTSNLFYDIYEIMNNLHLFEAYNYDIHSLHISEHAKDSVDCYEMFRKGYNDSIHHSSIINIDEAYNNAFEYIFFETNTNSVNDYFISMVQIVILILKHQKYGGHTIIKIKDMLYKPIIDCLYFLSSLYDKVYIVKPNTNNITSLDRYIVCKSFLHDETSKSYLRLNSLHLIILLKKLENKTIASILGCDIPYYFKNKIDDLNIIIGQQQIEALDQIVAIFKNKNKHDKIETLKKSNIQKSVSWCEKYNIPCNKFTEKINIFLPIEGELVNI